MFSILRTKLGIYQNLNKVFQDSNALSNTMKNFSLSSVRPNNVKTIVERKDGNTLVVEGVLNPSPREKILLKTDPESKACPLCRLNLDVKHTDVLILSQFVRKDGCMLPKRVTGLCSVQQKRVSYMVTMAHKAGLMGGFKPANSKADPTKRKQWKKFNTYFDESTIRPPKMFLYMKYQNKIKEFQKTLTGVKPKVLEVKSEN